jgi:hypothetical protein
MMDDVNDRTVMNPHRHDLMTSAKMLIVTGGPEQFRISSHQATKPWRRLWALPALGPGMIFGI